MDAARLGMRPGDCSVCCAPLMRLPTLGKLAALPLCRRRPRRRRLRHRERRAGRRRPGLRGRGAVRGALLGLPHLRGRRHGGLGQPRSRRARTRTARTSTSARRPRRTCSTPSRTAASPRVRCRRTSSRARTRRRSRTFIAKYSGPERAQARAATSAPERASRARPEGDPPRPGPGARRARAPPRRVRRSGCDDASWRSTRRRLELLPEVEALRARQNEASQGDRARQEGRRGRERRRSPRCRRSRAA